MILSASERFKVVHVMTKFVRQGPIELRGSNGMDVGANLISPLRLDDLVAVLPQSVNLLEARWILRFVPKMRKIRPLRVQVNHNSLVFPQAGPVDQSAPARLQDFLLPCWLSQDEGLHFQTICRAVNQNNWEPE